MPKLSEVEIQRLRFQAEFLLEQGNLDETEAIYDDAIAFFEQALDIYVQLDDVEGQIVANLKVAMVHQRQSAFKEAAALCRKASTVIRVGT